ncbi:MAG: YqaE/Pmp3 family membrane protein [Chloroflexi bacterium]|nr:YqaE/Pmp3 family membrane protein [Chloroflexota bacterium]
MRYLLAILLPPVGMLLAGKPFQALFCLILQITILGWIPAAIWAVAVTASSSADRRTRRIIEAIERTPR